MKRKVRLRPAAEADLYRLAEFIVEKNPRAALRLGETLRNAILSLDEMAERGRPGPRKDLRELVVRFGRSRYIVRYAVREREVIVTRIWHGRERRD